MGTTGIQVKMWTTHFSDMTQKCSATTASWATFGVIVIVVTLEVPLFYQPTHLEIQLNPCFTVTLGSSGFKL